MLLWFKKWNLTALPYAKIKYNKNKRTMREFTEYMGRIGIEIANKRFLEGS